MSTVPINEQIAAVWRVIDAPARPVRANESADLQRKMKAVHGTLKLFEKYEDRIARAEGAIP